MAYPITPQYPTKTLQQIQPFDFKGKSDMFIFAQFGKNRYKTSLTGGYPQNHPHTYPQELGITTLTA